MWDVDLPGAAARAERARPELTAAEASLLASFPASDAVTLDELVVRTGQGRRSSGRAAGARNGGRRAAAARKPLPQTALRSEANAA